MTNFQIKRRPARRHDLKRKLKDFLKRHLLRHLPSTPPTPTIKPGMVSCLMMTRGNVGMVCQSLASFNDQNWPDRELIMVTVNVTDELEDLIRSQGQGRVKLVQAQNGLTMGEQRNLTLAHCSGEYVCIWDDDDLYSPDRVKKSVEALLKGWSRCHFPRQASALVANQSAFGDQLFAAVGKHDAGPQNRRTRLSRNQQWRRCDHG